MVKASCTVAGCDRPHRAKGLCSAHYQRAFHGRKVEGPVQIPTRERQDPICTFGGCGRAAKSKGLCASHYLQQRQGRPLSPVRDRYPAGSTCRVDRCSLKATHKGLCPTHYDRQRRGVSDWDRPVRDKAPDGSGWVTDDGYRMIYRDGRAVPEHRALAEELLGRSLLPGENVHHLYGQRSENEPDGPFRVDGHELRSGNLSIWSTKQPAGQAVPDKLAYVVEMVGLYGDWLTAEQRAVIESGLERSVLRERGYRPVGEVVEEAQAILAEHGTEGERGRYGRV